MAELDLKQLVSTLLRMGHRFSKIGISFAAFFAVGCGSPALTHSPEVLRRHIIVVDGKGQPHDPLAADGKPCTMAAYRNQIKAIFEAMRTYHQQYPDRKVLVFVHGGLNSLDDSLQAADGEMDPAMRAGFYPIFLDWDSGLLDAYSEHVATITQGQTNNTLGRALMSPFYAASDVGRAILRAPIVWMNQISGDLQGAGSDVASLPANSPAPRWANGAHGAALAKVYQQLRETPAKDAEGRSQKLHIIIGPDLDVKAAHMIWLGSTYAVTLLPKLLLEPVIDWMGTPAWEVMTRRTLIAFDGNLGGNASEPVLNGSLDTKRDARWKKATDFSTTGAMEIFREELEHITADNVAATQPIDSGYQVTLVAHSAGTLVLNEWLRRDMLEKKQQRYRQIVYMAAACSVRDFSRAVVPYLLQNPDTKFYSLMLHPIAELRERIHVYDLPPRGSLLVWLDDYLTNPLTPLDRTLGRWDNIIQATEAIPESVRPQVTLKAFPLAPDNGAIRPTGVPDYGPQNHGDFRGRPYWCPEFWASEEPLAPGLESCAIEQPLRPRLGN